MASTRAKPNSLSALPFHEQISPLSLTLNVASAVCSKNSKRSRSSIMMICLAYRPPSASAFGELKRNSQATKRLTRRAEWRAEPSIEGARPPHSDFKMKRGVSI